MLVALEDNYPLKDGLLRVEWNLGKRCNYDCSYCGPEIHDNFSPHISKEVFAKTCLQLVAAGKQQGKKVKIALTGGEPFVHPEIIDLLKIAKDIGIDKISATTNGSVPLKKYLEAIEYMDYIVFSYHFECAYDEKVVDTIVGLQPIIKLYQAENTWKDMHVHIMFLPGTMDRCKEIMATLNEHDVQYTIRRIRPRIAGPYYSNEEIEWMKNAE